MSTGNVETAGAFPADLQSVMDELDKADREARQLLAELTEADLNWQPGGGTGWSVLQCLDHLAQSNALYIGALREAVRDVKPGAAPRAGPIRPGWFGRWFVREMEPPPRRKIKAQKKVSPMAHKNGGEVLKAFLAAHDEVRSVVREGRAMDLNRVRFSNPFIRLFHFTVGTGLMVIGAHDRRHLWQARQVMEQMKTARAQGSGAGPAAESAKPRRSQPQKNQFSSA